MFSRHCVNVKGPLLHDNILCLSDVTLVPPAQTLYLAELEQEQRAWELGMEWSAGDRAPCLWTSPVCVTTSCCLLNPLGLFL